MSDDEEMTGLGESEFAAKPNLITKTLTIISATFLFCMMALTFADVIGRYFLNAPITGASEIIAFLLGLTIFTAFPLVTRDRAHITVGLFERFFKGRIRYAQRLFVLVGTIGVVGFVAWLMFDQGRTMYEAQFLTEYLDLPQAPIVFVLSALGVVAGLVFISVIWGYLRRGGDPEEAGGKH